MQALKRLFDFYINASIHIAFGTVALVYITQLEYNISKNISILLFVFFATLVGYNFVKYFGFEKSQQINQINDLKSIRLITIFCVIPLLYFFFKLDKASWSYFVILGLITFFYGIPFVYNKTSLRTIRGIKAYVVAFVWCITTVIVPIVNSENIVSHDVVITAIQRFLLIFVLMFPFEIRDMKYDDVKLATIPQIIGVKRTKILGVFLALVFFLLEFFKDNLQSNWILVNVFLSVAIVLVVMSSSESQNKYFSSFWVDGILLFWLGLLLFIEKFLVEGIL